MRTFFFCLLLSLPPILLGQQPTFHYSPLSSHNYQILQYQHYSLAYSETHEQAAWVAYELTAEQLNNKIAGRKDDFREDRRITTGCSSLKDYKRSGYDRGHLAPAADFCFSSTAMSESFFMSNMSPQLPGFNRGIWKKLEEKVREFALQNEKIYVITGGILEDALPSIGPNQVAIPNYYYKVLLDYSEPQIKAIAFLLPHQSSSQSLQSFSISIDSVESLTGLDFFPQLGDSLQSLLEATNDPLPWFATPTESEKKLSAVQCLGIAKSTGKRCMITWGLKNGYCRYHERQGK